MMQLQNKTKQWYKNIIPEENTLWCGENSRTSLLLVAQEGEMNWIIVRLLPFCTFS